MPSDALDAHSHVEAILYLMVTRCAVCHTGELESSPESAKFSDGVWQVAAQCKNCGSTEAYHFRVADAPVQIDPLSSATPINATPATSRIIDAVQWVTLAHLLDESSAKTPDATERRWRRIRAAQCFDEALKFYDADNELPPSRALYTDASRSAVREHPQRFARSRLLDQRAALPADGVANRVNNETNAPRKPWWRFWQGS